MWPGFLEGLADPRVLLPPPPHPKALQLEGEKSQPGRTALPEAVAAPRREVGKARCGERELGCSTLLPGPGVKGEFELLLLLLSYPVTVLGPTLRVDFPEAM